jgi:large subunit ribosomal protein L28
VRKRSGGGPWGNHGFPHAFQRVRVLLHGKAQRAYVCTRCLKAGKVQKAV